MFIFTSNNSIMYRLFILSIISILCFQTQAQKRAWQNVYADYIDVADLEKHLEILASDEYEGRATGQKGQKMAANYMADYYKSIGIKPVGENGTYFQTIPLEQQSWDKVNINIDGKDFEMMKDFYCFGRQVDEGTITSDQIVFAGYGIADENYNDYQFINVRNKVVLILDGEPKNTNGNYLVSGEAKTSKWSTSWRAKLTEAKERGAKALFVVKDNISNQINRYEHSIEAPSTKLIASEKNRRYPQTFYISNAMAKKLLGKKASKTFKKLNKKNNKGKTFSKQFASDISIDVKKKVKEMHGDNVFAYIEGSDLKDEVIVLTAHYDHLAPEGEKIYNGADDNGTGTVGLMEIAEAFTKAKENGHGPRRSILIFNNAAEEMGLLGSKHYTNEPLFPLDKTMACLNIDMIGRLDPKHEEAKDSNYVYIIGSDFLSTDLHKANITANEKSVNLNLDYAFNSYDDPNQFYYRSDHYNFVENGIPSIFYFSGVHVDYHKHTDTEDKIIYDKVEKITKLVFHTAWELANREGSLKIDVVPPANRRKR